MSSKTQNITLYLGIYNGEKYIDTLLEQIQSQDYQKFNILVVDNNSSDESKKMFGKWRKFYKDNFQFVKNEVNYGSHGSLFKNMDKIKTPWFCTLHQDDYYKPDHIRTISELILSNRKNVVGVSTTMGSMSNSGKILNSKPRVTWFSSNLDEPGQFLQNLKAQTVPFPATAFNLSVFKKTVVPFHSPTFSDTEQTLRMLGYGRFIFSQKETMYYRENPDSESHVLNIKERTIGASVALSRIFNSNEFDLILNKVVEKKRNLFATQLIEALSHRIPEKDLLIITQTIALERMIAKWGYGEKILSSLLGKNYADISSPLAVNVINNLSNNKILVKRKKSGIRSQSFASRIWDIYFNLNIFNSTKLNKIFLINFYRIIFIVKPNHRLKNKWK
jgi:glycosyltransferase involved in cell wall biosynthesis